MTPLRLLRTAAVGTVTVLAAGLLANGSVSAQDVGGKQAEVDRLARELDQLQSKASALNEQYLETGEQLQDLQSKIAGNEAAVADAQTQMDAASAQANSYAVSAYIGAGSGLGVGVGPGTGDPNQAVNQKVLLETVQGDRRQVADDLRAAKLDLADKTAELQASTEDLEAKQAEQASLKDDIESSVGRQQELLDGANAELQAAVKAEQERRAAEAAARAEAEAKAKAAAAAKAAQEQAAKAAAASAARSATTTAPAAGRSAAPKAPKTTTPPAPVAPPAPISAPNGGAAAAIAAAQSVLGTPYKWAGTSPSTGFDCSGLTGWAWAQAGVRLPRSSGAQYAGTQRVPVDQLQPGDLVFFGSPISHVGLYIGGGQMIHSPHTGDVVKISSIYRGGGSLVGGGRVR